MYAVVKNEANFVHTVCMIKRAKFNKLVPMIDLKSRRFREYRCAGYGGRSRHVFWQDDQPRVQTDEFTRFVACSKSQVWF